MNMLQHAALQPISGNRGFLAPFEPASVTPPEFLTEVVHCARQLPEILPTGRVRQFIAALPDLDLEPWCNEAQEPELRMAMLRYAFLVQAYVWGEADAPSSLPVQIARPVWQLARRLDQKPLLPYSSYALDNWARFDPQGGFDLSNIHVIQSFLGGQDEAWFIMVHVAIEARAGAMLERIPALLEAAQQCDHAAVEDQLDAISKVWDDVNANFDRMPERCDPYIYFHRVRPFIHGWQDNPALATGLIYEGVPDTKGAPQAFRGQTGSQSSIVPTMDALFGIRHATDPLRAYLDELHHYRPPEHRAFIDGVRACSNLRDCVRATDKPALTEVYNDCLRKLARFRTRHLEYAASYINKQSRGSCGNAVEVGTGGTPFMKYLKKHRGETEQFLL
jgi:indoleamine 2,3-dioxygenase